MLGILRISCMLLNIGLLNWSSRKNRSFVFPSKSKVVLTKISPPRRTYMLAIFSFVTRVNNLSKPCLLSCKLMLHIPSIFSEGNLECEEMAPQLQ